MAQIRCPICDRRFESDESKWPPFCSERCRRIDLGRWLGEGYRVSVDAGEEAE
ncbi:MAG TPA: DNA gyrase inhibitor YacG, partial [Pirellulales bacterium]|nr:DNA gyrase inhibitor YacG [Pirellulales bacterium]